MLTNKLSELYGAQFPYDENAHRMALRMVLIEKMRAFNQGSVNWSRLSNAANQVTDSLRAMGVDPRSAPRAPRELVDHYRITVSGMWVWLHNLMSLQ